MRLSLIVVSLLLSACEMKQYVRADTPPEQKHRDTVECRYEAEKATASLINPFDRGMRNADLVQQCMIVRGYRHE
jgi:hypothetical protein